jgi:hypothetical protein
MIRHLNFTVCLSQGKAAVQADLESDGRFVGHYSCKKPVSLNHVHTAALATETMVAVNSFLLNHLPPPQRPLPPSP